MKTFVLTVIIACTATVCASPIWLPYIVGYKTIRVCEASVEVVRTNTESSFESFGSGSVSTTVGFESTETIDSCIEYRIDTIFYR